MRICDRCRQPIEWGVVWSLTEDQAPRRRSRMPLDPPDRPTGVAPNVAVHRGGGTLWARVLDNSGFTLSYETLRTTHFATCAARPAVTREPLPDNVIPLRRQLRIPGTRGRR
jgi:hypothetical protein